MYHILGLLLFLLVISIAMGLYEDRKLQRERSEAKERVELITARIKLYDRMASRIKE